MNTPNPFLPDFDKFNQLWAQLKNPDLSGTAIQQILQNDPKVWGIDVLDHRIGNLLSNHFDLSDAGRSLFQKKQTWREMDKGVSEISVLAEWNKAGLLIGTAFPPQATTKTNAPFDAHLSIAGFAFGGDIKTATTAASGVILERLEPKLETWAKSKGISLPELELSINGSLDLRRLGPRWAEIINQFEAGLQTMKNNVVSINLDCPLPGDPNDPTGAGDLQIRVTLLPAGGDPTHTWIRFRDSSVEFAKSLIENHATEKGRHVDGKGNPIPFILAYHRRGKPGDLSPKHVADAMLTANGPSHWLGTVYLDELATPFKTCHIHASASFPERLSPDDLKQELER